KVRSGHHHNRYRSREKQSGRSNDLVRILFRLVDLAFVRWLMTEDLATIEDLSRRPEWQRYGACHGEYVETFIPGLGGNFTRARELCGRCPVRQECLVTALADPEVVGLWGGTSQRERRK